MVHLEDVKVEEKKTKREKKYDDIYFSLFGWRESESKKKIIDFSRNKNLNFYFLSLPL